MLDPVRATEFLRAFLPLVVDVTGELFSAQTFQKLLRQMTPYRTPSSTTVHIEIHKYPSEARADAQLAPSDPPGPSANAIADIATLNRTRSRRMDTESGSRDEAAPTTVELGKLHQLEVEQLRSRAEIMEARAAAADAARQGAVTDAIAARAEAVGLQEAWRTIRYS